MMREAFILKAIAGFYSGRLDSGVSCLCGAARAEREPLSCLNLSARHERTQDSVPLTVSVFLSVFFACFCAFFSVFLRVSLGDSLGVFACFSRSEGDVSVGCGSLTETQICGFPSGCFCSVEPDREPGRPGITRPVPVTVFGAERSA